METAQTLASYAPSKCRPGAVCAFVKTVVTTTMFSGEDKMAQIIAQLQKTRLNFSILSQLQRKRVRNMQKLIRRKNGVIATLAARLNTRTSKSKHFAVTICENLVYTTSGSKQFVEQRVAKLGAIGGEHVFNAQRTDCARDRRRIAKALIASLGAGVKASANNKRFEIRDADKIVSAKLIIQQVLHNGNHCDARAY
ncbi:BV/ODV-E26 [Choristoneura diversana nucleopolyhedrovirus]|nr:BV/ODV-E26 [Choristoneura diversana nucleopolyhedrovirus]